MAKRPALDADNIHAVVTTRWNSGSYQPYTINSVESYTIETNLDEDSDPFNLLVGDPTGEFAEILRRDNEVRVQIFGLGENINYLMTGIVDTAVYSDEGSIVCSGRDLSCVATDTIAEPIVYRHVRASDVIADRARKLRCAPRLSLTPTNILGKMATDGSETEWEFWYRFVRRAAQWLWYEPDGRLTSGKLNYDTEPVYYIGDPPKNDNNPGIWIPVERGEFHSSKQQRLYQATVYYHNGKRILPVTVNDPTITDWIRKPTKLFEQKDIHHPKSAQRFAKEEIFESQVGAQEVKLIVPDPGIQIRQNTMARLNVPDLNLAGDWFIVGTRIIADITGFTQEVRLREKNYAISRRVPSDPPTSQEPGQDATTNLKDTLALPNHPEWAEYFIRAAQQWHGNKEFTFFLAVLLAICEQETNFRNIRAHTGGTTDGFASAPGVHGVEYFEWDKSAPGPQNGITNLAEWRISFANEPGAYVNMRIAVGPMQLYSPGLKIQADNFFNPDVEDELYGGRWAPEANIWIAAKYLHELCVQFHVDNADNDSIWIAVSAYGGSTAYGNSVRARITKWYDFVKESFAQAQAEEAAKAVEAVQGSVQDIAGEIIQAASMRPAKYRDDNGQQLSQLRSMRDGLRIQSPCAELGKIQISAKVLGVIKLLIDSGFWVGTFALAADHDCFVDGTSHFSRHSSGNAVDISSLGTPDTGWVTLNTNSKSAERLVIAAMNVLRAQKRGVLKPDQLICNGVGVTNKVIQSLQLNNFEDANYITGDHLNHMHVGF